MPPVVGRPAIPPIDRTHNVFLAGIGGTGIVTVNQVLATAALRAGLRRRGPRPDRPEPEGRTGHVAPAARRRRSSSRPTGSRPATRRLRPRLRPAHRGRRQEPRLRQLAAAPSPSRRPARPRPATWSTTRPSATPTRPTLLDRLGIGSSRDDRRLRRARRRRGAVRQHRRRQLPAGRRGLPGRRAAACPPRPSRRPSSINGVAVEREHRRVPLGPRRRRRPGRVRRGRHQLGRRRTAAHRRPGAPVRRHPPLDGEVRRLVGTAAPPSSSTTRTRRVAAPLRRRWCSRRGTPSARLTEPDRVQRGRRRAGCSSSPPTRTSTRWPGCSPTRRSSTPSQARSPGGEKLTYKLHPPVLQALGRKKKIGFGPQSHVALQDCSPRAKVLRGTALDPFGYAHVRTVERELLDALRTAMVLRLAAELDAEHLRHAPPRSPRLPDVVRGYEDVKLAQRHRLPPASRRTRRRHLHHHDCHHSGKVLRRHDSHRGTSRHRTARKRWSVRSAPISPPTPPTSR